jgi:hypothetical protein
MCVRRTMLADIPSTRQPSSPGPGSRYGGIGPHLHPDVPVGVRVPLPVVQASAGSSHPLQVVVVGRFVADEPASCAGSGRDCGEGFVIERIAWADGKEYSRIVTIDPALDVSWFDRDVQLRRTAAQTAFGLDRTLPDRLCPALDTGANRPGGGAPPWTWRRRGSRGRLVPAVIERGYDLTRYPLGEAPRLFASSTTRPVRAVARGTDAAEPPVRPGRRG